MIPSTSKIDTQAIIIAYLAFVALGLPGGLLGVAWPSMRDTFMLPTSALGTLLMAITVGYLIASFFNGRIISTLGIGRALVAASVLSALGLAVYSLGLGWWLIVTISVLLGIGQGVVDASMNLYFANHYGPRLMNWLHAAFGLGAALGPLLMTTLFSLGQSWRWGYVVMAALQLMLALMFFATLHCWRTTRAEDESNDNKAIPLADTLQRPLVWMSIALFFAFVGIETVVGNWSFILLTESRAIDIITAGQWVSLYWWSFTIGRLLFGFVANRLPTIRTIRACMLLIFAGSALLTANIGPIATFIALAVVGFAQAPIFPLLITATPQRLGANHAPNAIGFQISAAGLSIAALPALAGYLAERSSFEIIGPFLMVMAILAFVLFNLLSIQSDAHQDVKFKELR